MMHTSCCQLHSSLRLAIAGRQYFLWLLLVHLHHAGRHMQIGKSLSPLTRPAHINLHLAAAACN